MRSQQLCMTRHFNGIKPVLNLLPDVFARFVILVVSVSRTYEPT